MLTKLESNAAIFKYSFDITIERPIEAVWGLLCDSINDWWMNDFRALGEDSVVSLDTGTGGSLLEQDPNGATLEWYRVQMCMPGQSLYLTGYLAPDWGGPTVSMLKLSLESKDDSCILTVSDALLGSVTEKAANSAKDGWSMLFTDGLKRFVEN